MEEDNDFCYLEQLKKYEVYFRHDPESKELIESLIKMQLEKEKNKEKMKLNLKNILGLQRIKGVKIEKINNLYILSYKDLVVTFTERSFKEEILGEFEYVKIFTLFTAFFKERETKYLLDFFRFLNYRRDICCFKSKYYYIFNELLLIPEENELHFISTKESKVLFTCGIERTNEDYKNYKLFFCKRRGMNYYDDCVRSNGYYQILLNEKEIRIDFLYSRNIINCKDLNVINTMIINKKGYFINNEKNKVNRDLVFNIFSKSLIYFSKKNNQFYNFYLFRKEQDEIIRYTIDKEIIFQNIKSNSFVGKDKETIFSYFDLKTKKRYLFKEISLYPFKIIDYSDIKMDEETLIRLISNNEGKLYYDYFNNVFISASEYRGKVIDLITLTTYEIKKEFNLEYNYLLDSKLKNIKLEELKKKIGAD